MSQIRTLAVERIGKRLAIASPEEIARAVGDNTQLAAQVVAAAKLVADPANAKEQEFVSRLSGELGMSGGLVSHISAALPGLRAG